MTHSGYWARQSHAHGDFDKSMSSTAGDFRDLTPLVLMAALRAGRHGGAASRCTASGSSSRPTRSARSCPRSRGCGAVPERTDDPRRRRACSRARSRPRACTQLQQRLPGLTRGEGVLESAFDRYEPVTGPVPTRSRSTRGR